MLTKLTVHGFDAVPQLETTGLMRHLGGEIAFSLEKPNVIVGPNGSGKSSLLQAIAIRFLADLVGHTALHQRYLDDFHYPGAWAATSSWTRERADTWLKGLSCETDEAPALWFRPAHIPGNEPWVNTAMMTGFSDEARTYRKLTHNRSSGEQGSALLKRMFDALDGQASGHAVDQSHWQYGLEPKAISYDAMEWVKRAEVLKAQVRRGKPDGIPLVVLDEPEQSLDCRAEGLLWQKIAGVRPGRVQVIVATHSLHPMLTPDRFNLISAEPGYADACLSLLGVTTPCA